MQLFLPMRIFLRIIGIGLIGFVPAVVKTHAAESSPPNEMMREAIDLYALGERHWAYVEVKREYDRKGRLKEETVSRVDPSLPWNERDVLVSADGEPASERAQRRYQKQREKERRARERGAHRERRLRDLIDFDGIEVQSRDGNITTLALPIRPDPDTPFPVEKIAMTAAIDTASRDLIRIEATLREAVRHKAVANIKGMNLAIRFAPVVPEDRPPAIVHLHGTARATVMFFPIGGSVEIERTDYRWVTPYDDRFKVEVGPATAIDF